MCPYIVRSYRRDTTPVTNHVESWDTIGLDEQQAQQISISTTTFDSLIFTIGIIYLFSLVMIVQAFLLQFEEPTISFFISLGFALLFILLVFLLAKKKVHACEN